MIDEKHCYRCLWFEKLYRFKPRSGEMDVNPIHHCSHHHFTFDKPIVCNDFIDYYEKDT